MKLIVASLLFVATLCAQYVPINGSVDTPAGSVTVLNAKLAFTVNTIQPATCTNGKEVWVDNSVSPSRWFLCNGTNTWAEIINAGRTYANPSWISSLDWSKLTNVPSFEPAVTAGTNLQYYRGDKTWQTLNTSIVPEGTNQYFTSGRALAAVTWSTMTGIPSTFAPTPHALLSASHSDACAGSPVLGDLMIGGAGPCWNKLTGNPLTTRKFLRQTGNGTTPAAQVWDTLLAVDIPNNNADTTGNANTATAFKTAPTPCSSGNAPTGIDINGNSINCAPVGGGGAGALYVTGIVLDGALNHTIAGSAHHMNWPAYNVIVWDTNTPRNTVTVAWAMDSSSNDVVLHFGTAPGPYRVSIIGVNNGGTSLVWPSLTNGNWTGMTNLQWTGMSN